MSRPEYGDAARPAEPDLSLDRFDLHRLRSRLLAEVDLAELARLTPSQRRVRLERVMGHLVSAEGPLLTSRERGALVRHVVDEALGLGILEPLLDDDSITEIMVNGPNEIYVERAGRLERVNARFSGEPQLYQTIDRIVAAVNRRVDESSPMVDARLPGGERVNVVIPPLAVDGPVLTIRRFPRPLPLPELIARGALDRPTADLLGALVRARLNIVISGGTGSGKTTMLNALSSRLPDRERIVTIEDSAELRLHQRHVVRLEARPANTEGTGQVSIRDLVRNSLRMRPDRIIVGEVRGGETLDMLQAMNTGHEGSLATVHANSPADALIRLETLAGMSETRLSLETLRDQINSAVDIVVQVSRLADGSRRLTAVSVLLSTHHEAFRLVDVVRFDPRAEVAAVGTAPARRGALLHGPLPPALARRLEAAGESVPAVFTGTGGGAPWT